MKTENILTDAKSAPAKGSLETHREAILLLRDKGYTWRDISDFLAERGVQADHTKIYRFFNKSKPKASRKVIMTVINSETYEKALNQISITDKQKMMLKAHFEAPNRSITYTHLAEAAGYDDYAVANRQYGQLGRDLGEAVSFQFADAETRPGEKFYSSSIGMPNAYTTGEFQLVMHHELSKAIENLQMF
ncbi:hypothetical protein JYT79_03035 [Cardiobacterium sp. AH-315-I02]|nr:hypothetical protein [Cardiobacterium sp. AH-315-I02]